MLRDSAPNSRTIEVFFFYEINPSSWPVGKMKAFPSGSQKSKPSLLTIWTSQGWGKSTWRGKTYLSSWYCFHYFLGVGVEAPKKHQNHHGIFGTWKNLFSTLVNSWDIERVNSWAYQGISGRKKSRPTKPPTTRWKVAIICPNNSTTQNCGGPVLDRTGPAAFTKCTERHP